MSDPLREAIDWALDTQFGASDDEAIDAVLDALRKHPAEVLATLGMVDTEWRCHPAPGSTPDRRRWFRFHDKNSVHMDGCVPVFAAVPEGDTGCVVGAHVAGCECACGACFGRDDVPRMDILCPVHDSEFFRAAEGDTP